MRKKPFIIREIYQHSFIVPRQPFAVFFKIFALKILNSKIKHYLRTDFGSADSVGNQHYVFNIRGNKYRLVVVVKFLMGYVFIRFVGTHEEYDKIDAKTI